MDKISKVIYNGKVISYKKMDLDYTHAVVIVYSDEQTQIVSYETSELDANIVANYTKPIVVVVEVKNT